MKLTFFKKGHLRLFNHDKSLPLEVNASCTAIHPAFEIHKNSDIIVFLQYYHSFTVGGHCKFGWRNSDIHLYIDSLSHPIRILSLFPTMLSFC